MKNNKLCCRIFPIVLILVSSVFALAIWYFDEGVRSFDFLTNKGEIFNFLGTILFISIAPIGIFYYLNDKEKYQTKARAISLIGFVPALLFLIYIVV